MTTVVVRGRPLPTFVTETGTTTEVTRGGTFYSEQEPGVISGWQVDFSTPRNTKIRTLAAIAAISSGAFYVAPAPVQAAVPVDSWVQPLSQPLNRAPVLAGDYRTSALTPITPKLESWYRPFSEPTRLRRPQQNQWAAFVPAIISAPPVVIPVESWVQPFPTPQRRDSSGPVREYLINIKPMDPPALMASGWEPPLNLPFRPKPPLPLQQWYTFLRQALQPPPVLMAQGWEQQTQNPNINLPPRFGGDYRTTDLAPNLFVFDWFDTFSEPVRRSRRSNMLRQWYTMMPMLPSPPPPPPSLPSDWLQQFTTPVQYRILPSIGGSGPDFGTPFIEVVNTPMESWYNEFEEPVRRQFLHAKYQQFEFRALVAGTAVLSSTTWMQPLSEPVRARFDSRRHRALLAPALTLPNPIPPPPTILPLVYPPLNEPQYKTLIDTRAPVGYISYAPPSLGTINMTWTGTESQDSGQFIISFQQGDWIEETPDTFSGWIEETAESQGWTLEIGEAQDWTEEPPS